MNKNGLALAKSFAGRRVTFPETLFFKFITFVLPKLLSRDYGALSPGRPGRKRALVLKIYPGTAEF
ncbi:MAG: hypothetical protein WBL50_04625 [Candidatus Acidiferrum sp.]